MHTFDKSSSILKGTTTIGIVCSDGVVLATDTRATMGYFVAHKRAKKVYPIDDHLAMTIAGAVGDAQAMVNILKANSQLYKFENNVPMPVGTAARLLSNVLFQSRMMPYILQAIVAGVDESGPRIYALDPLGSLIEEKFVSTGSGSPVAYGVLESQLKKKMSVEEALPVITRAIKSAMERDAATGDSFDIVTITKDGYRDLSGEEKKNILS
jgi:proteasome beta subunit